MIDPSQRQELQHVADFDTYADTVTALEALLEKARAGEVCGLVFLSSDREEAYHCGLAGNALSDPVQFLVALRDAELKFSAFAFEEYDL
jgi:hypothetical protein